MRHTLIARAAVASLAVLVLGCGAEPEPPPGPAATSTGSNDGAALTDGFPCDVQSMLQVRCAGCHTGQTYAPQFRRPADFRGVAPDGTTLGAYALARMQSATRPMPPVYVESRPGSDEIASFARWVTAGMPDGACGPVTPPH